MANTKKTAVLPLIPVRGIIIFPSMILHFDVARKRSAAALEAAMANGQQVFLAAQKDLSVEKPGENDIYIIGTVARVKQMLKLPGNMVRVLVEGLYRAKITDFMQTEPFMECAVSECKSVMRNTGEVEIEAIKRMISEIWREYETLNPKVSTELLHSIENMDSLSQYADSVASGFLQKLDAKQEILEELNVFKRLTKLVSFMTSELELMRTERDIYAKVKSEIDQNQRNYYLREQIKVIMKELGEDEDEIEEYKKRVEERNLTDEVKEKLNKEISRLEKTAVNSPDAGVIRTYLDNVLEMPYGVYTKETLSLKKAERILNRDHYGLQKVKERILEYLSVRILSGNLSGQILCLVGPPGVGKTSIAKSIAEALGRNYARISLGGVRDEAEIRGHRRTYIGSMPGRIISALKNTGSMNPLLLLDEVDKLGSDYKGDPSSALLEVLDSAQNFAFRDHYLELPTDLSDVLFITTANSLDTVPRPLLDRMEVIELSGYTSEEKENIAVRHLIPRALLEHGIKHSQLKISKGAVLDVILYYTREAGVRNLEREIKHICRKAAAELVGGAESVSVTQRNLEKYLGKKRFRFEKLQDTEEIGVVRGLAWTAAGGDTLSIEVNVTPGSGHVELTGKLGEVMQESAKAAISYIRSKANELGIDSDFYKTKDIHLHVPEGAVPKDGPSAGITICTAMVSALTGRAVPSDLAMTGEVTIRGRVLPVGGIKEKVLAAYRFGVKKIIMPSENRFDIEEIPEEIRKKIIFLFADDMNFVLANALIPLEKSDVINGIDEIQTANSVGMRI